MISSLDSHKAKGCWEGCGGSASPTLDQQFGILSMPHYAPPCPRLHHDALPHWTPPEGRFADSLEDESFLWRLGRQQVIMEVRNHEIKYDRISKRLKGFNWLCLLSLVSEVSGFDSIRSPRRAQWQLPAGMHIRDQRYDDLFRQSVSHRSWDRSIFVLNRIYTICIYIYTIRYTFFAWRYTRLVYFSQHRQLARDFWVGSDDLDWYMSSSITKHISEAKVASTSLGKHRLTICMLEKAGAHPRRWRITMRNPWCWCMKKAIAFQCYNLVRRRSMMYFVKKSGDMSLRIESWGICWAYWTQVLRRGQTMRSSNDLGSASSPHSR